MTELTLSFCRLSGRFEKKYRAGGTIGKGGMGCAIARRICGLIARSRQINHGQSCLARAALQRFEREARASAKLNHPTLSQYDYGRAALKAAIWS